MPRHFAIGDIHGCFTALQTLLDFVRPEPEDVLITLGDYVNRGPDSKQVIEWLIKETQRGQLKALRGNHEIIMIEAREQHARFKRFLKVGGGATLESYADQAKPESMAAIPEQHWHFLEQNLLAYYETQDHFFVHANADANLGLNDQPDDLLYWESLRGASPHVSGKKMVCGHSSQKSGCPLVLEHAICLDTHAHGGGWLTCLCVETSQIWQANQNGETRQSYIDDFLKSA